MSESSKIENQPGPEAPTPQPEVEIPAHGQRLQTTMAALAARPPEELRQLSESLHKLAYNPGRIRISRELILLVSGLASALADYSEAEAAGR